MKYTLPHQHARALARLALASAALTISLTSAAGGAVKILDGVPKKIIVNNRFSWGMGSAFKNTSKLGVDYFEVSSPEWNEMPITDSLTVKAGSWLEKSVDLSAETKPVVFALSLWSLGVYVATPADSAGINLGVAKLTKLDQVLRQKGAAHVFVGTGHYARKRGRDWQSSDQWNLHDTCIINKYNRVTGNHYGVDILTPSIQGFPYIVVSDLEHPTGYCKDIYMVSWLRAMYQQDGATVPEASFEQYLAGSHNSAKSTKERLSIALVDPAAPLQYRVGAQYTVRITADDRIVNEKVNLIGLGLRGGCALLYKLKDSLALDGKTEMTVTVELPDSASPLLYGSSGGRYTNPALTLSDTFGIQVMITNWKNVSSEWAVTPMMPIAGRQGSGIQPILSVNGASSARRSESRQLVVHLGGAAGYATGGIVSGAMSIGHDILGRTARSVGGKGTVIVPTSHGRHSR